MPQIVVTPYDAWLDPDRDVVERIVADPDAFLTAYLGVTGWPRPDRSWFDAWCDAETRARGALDAHLDADDEPFEGRVARDVVDAVPDGGTLVVASSMPVRDVESFARPRDGVRFVANRGANGIDGFVSTAIGAALGGDGPVVALLGDLCFLHDQNGLLGAASRGVDVTFVVVDNDGGGIFSFLPQAEAAPEHFEALFGTPQGVDIAAVAALHGIPTVEVTRASELRDAVARSVTDGGVRVVRVRTDRASNVARHRAAWAAVAARPLRSRLRSPRCGARLRRCCRRGRARRRRSSPGWYSGHTRASCSRSMPKSTAACWNASTASRDGARNAMWLSRKPSPVCCGPIQKSGNSVPYPMTSPKSSDARAADRREHRVVERPLRSRSAHWIDR